MNQHPIWPHIQAHEARLRAQSDAIRATPETCYSEHASAAAHMVHSATVMAITGLDAVVNEDLRAQAWADLKRRRGPEGYVFPLPEDAVPD